MIISFVYYAREAQDVFRGYPEMVHLNNKASFVPEPSLIEFLDHDGKSVGLVQAQTPMRTMPLGGKSRYMYVCWYKRTCLEIQYYPRVLSGCWIIHDNRLDGSGHNRSYTAETDAVVPPLEGWECIRFPEEVPTLRYVN